MILDSLITVVEKSARGKRIKDVRAGLGYTAVLLDNNSCGLAYTFRNELGPCCSAFGRAGEIKGIDCTEAIKWSKSRNLVQSAIGVATINALLQNRVKEYECDNVFKVLDIGVNDVLGVIGDFKPLTNGRGKSAKKMYVFERKTSNTDNYYPDHSISEHLPKCDIVVITSTSIINKTFDNIIEYCKGARKVAMVGATTPLCTEVFSKYKIDILAGVLVLNPIKLLDIVSQGGGTKHFDNNVKQIYIDMGNM
ncbi:DUF364 domain-containing protein [Clostridiisalibacter paucivorans]|uniref:DUF364 domain-containing protein n=1 Tax=Clostridiisalibacter paucivorans TaxID=408753 RepID=UPI0004787FC0|nr:DUF364 domain-containing protein [Clostridiisalibacter paucivorans]